MAANDQSIVHSSVGQRRAHYRAPATSDPPLELVAWKIPNHWVLRDRPKPSVQLRVLLVDLSVGGMCLNVLPHRIGPDALAAGDRLRIELKHKNETAVLDGQIIYRSGIRDDGSARIGFAFVRLENSIEGRRAATLLNRAIAELQRHGIKHGALVST